ncbi:lipopolysaccharide biosynthesis protein [Inhella gelatinilytica]|uniref:lipopolysaccharide biosynthesis protein n=1 Tax=Inhella gelatinilytica TaxID=2795030 RepID=UPI0028738C89|nr:oligosaccharide flippase family protein [Inhella gelatinilytica]
MSTLLRGAGLVGLGNGVAHALPLLLGPWLTRLFTPVEYAAFSLTWAAATNVAVVACGRYEYALPLARGATRARALVALCAWVLTGVVLLCGVWVPVLRPLEPTLTLLPVLVLALGGVQLLSMVATRAQRFGALALARVLQWGGAPALQVGAGLLQLGVWGLVLAPAFAAVAACACLWLLLRAGQGAWRDVRPTHLWAVARRYRDFPLLNTPHAFASAAQDTLALLLITAWAGDVATGIWALALRYLKAPATLVGSAVSAALYPALTHAPNFEAARAQLQRTVRTLFLMALPLGAAVMLLGPEGFAWAFGEPWRAGGEVARALTPYLVLHFVASPLAVVTMAWQAQAWALRLALVGQGLFLGGLAAGLALGGLVGAAWGVSLTMTGYFAFYLGALWRWKR